MLTMTRASALSLVKGLIQTRKPPKSLLRTPRWFRVHRTPRNAIARRVQVLSRPHLHRPMHHQTSASWAWQKRKDPRNALGMWGLVSFADIRAFSHWFASQLTCSVPAQGTWDSQWLSVSLQSIVW